MKTVLRLLLAVGIIFFTTNCSNMKNSAQQGQEISGVVAEQGITSYQYGTHTLTTDEDFYALTSETIDLDALVGQQVRLKVEKVEGYPIEGGPEYYRVLEVRQ